MKCREPVSIALGVFALFYFAEWAINKAKPEQCWIATEISETEVSYKWEDCKEIKSD